MIEGGARQVPSFTSAAKHRNDGGTFPLWQPLLFVPAAQFRKEFLQTEGFCGPHDDPGWIGGSRDNQAKQQEHSANNYKQYIQLTQFCAHGSPPRLRKKGPGCDVAPVFEPLQTPSEAIRRPTLHSAAARNTFHAKPSGM